jgi:hypothetical protein
MKAFSRTLSHDWPALALVLFNLLGIGLYLGVGPARQEGTGYRVIDAAAVRRLLDANPWALLPANSVPAAA